MNKRITLVTSLADVSNAKLKHLRKLKYYQKNLKQIIDLFLTF